MFIYDTCGRKAVKEFLRNTCEVTVTNTDGKIEIENDNGDKIEISHILYQWLVNKKFISEIK